MGELRFTWDKSSHCRYVVRGVKPDISVVRSGRAKLLNYRWHPDVFGNHFLGPSGGFATWVEAALMAEALAFELASSIHAHRPTDRKE